MSQSRQFEHPVEPFILERWSPRSFIPVEMPENDLMSLFEAAKWAPSSYNNQPWRFLYAKRESAYWTLFLNLLGASNQAWAGNASVLVVVIANTKFDHNGKLSVTHSFDAGAAWQNLALQAWLKGYVTHGMQGFDFDKARTDLEVPADFQIECMLAIGKQGPKEQLPDDLQEREVPSPRRPLCGTIVEGKFSSALLHT